MGLTAPPRVQPGTARLQRRTARPFTVPEWVLPAAVSLFLLVAWHVAVVVLKVPERLVPTPVAVAEEIAARLSLLTRHGQLTLLTALAGLLVAFAIAIPLALLIASSGFLERWVSPVLSASDAVPKIAIAPLLIIFLGIGLTPRIFLATLTAFFPIVLQAMMGLHSVHPEMKNLTRSMGASWLQTTLKVSLPQAAPAILSGIRISIPLAFAGALTGEVVAPRDGLGYLLVQSAAQYDGRLMFASIVVIVLLCTTLFFVVDRAERYLLHWHPSARREHIGGSL